MTLIYILIGITTLLIISRIYKSSRKCIVCGQSTHDIYRDFSNKIILLCRNHLVERWSDDVNKSTVDMIVIEPDFTSYPLGYMYADIDRLQQWQYPKEAQDNVNTILDAISGNNCAQCKEQASVAYFNKESFQPPLMENISSKPLYLCKKCTVYKVAPLIQHAPSNLNEGVYAPLNIRGIYHVQEF